MDVRILSQTGVDALKRGDAKSARAAFEAVVDAGRADASLCLALMAACHATGDQVASRRALERALAIEPQNVRALTLMADELMREGDERAAAAYYLSAVKSAPPREAMPAELADEVARAESMCVRIAGAFETVVRRHLCPAQSYDSVASPRFAQSLDILFGRKSRYAQAPRYYFFPGLPVIEFFEHVHFPWLSALEAATAAIRGEVLALLKDGGAFHPYVEGYANRPHNPQYGMLNNPDWSAFYLWKQGRLIEENAARCPQTMRALRAMPLGVLPNRSPSVLFSVLRPGAHIPAHNGMVNTRLIGHLPLIAPLGCTFRVGSELRDWEEGKAWLFDDTIEHEAWNRSDETRVVLLFEIWRPELTEAERAQVCALFHAIDEHSGSLPSWEI